MPGENAEEFKQKFHITNEWSITSYESSSYTLKRGDHEVDISLVPPNKLAYKLRKVGLNRAYLGICKYNENTGPTILNDILKYWKNDRVYVHFDPKLKL